MYRELLLGCGNSREKRVHPPSREPGSATAEYERAHFVGELVTLDIDSSCKPDVEFNLRRLNARALNSLPFDDNSFDELHAYEVLEHIAPQGDYSTFFIQFGAFWKALKPNGYFCATVPHWKSIWAWGDPGHMRVISAASLVFLDRTQYDKQVGVTSMTDYRAYMGDMDFRLVSSKSAEDTFTFVLRAVK